MLKDKYIPQLEKIIGGRFDKISVHSSPYLRTMMTAAHLTIGLEHVAPIEVNYMFSEVQEEKKKRGYDGNQIPKLLSKTTDKERFTKQYMSGQTFIDEGLNEDYIMKRFPETEDDIPSRAADFTSYFNELYNK